jgi:hypothetical protein
MKQIRFGLLSSLMTLLLSLTVLCSGKTMAQTTDELPNTWGSAGFLVGAAQSSEINETGGVLGAFGYGVQNNLMIGGEGYLFTGGGIKGAIAMVNVGMAFDDWVQQGRYRRVLMPYVGIGGGSIESRQNSQESDSGVFFSTGVQFRLKTQRHSYGFRAMVMKGGGSPLWVLGVTIE